MRVVLTGSAGFLGWHTRLRLQALTDHEVIPVGRQNWQELGRLCEGAHAIIHIAGVNRGEDREVEHGNVSLAEAVAAAVRGARGRPRIIFANSTRSGEDSPYGRGKARASETLRRVALEGGTDLADVRLPNLFGPHGRAGYNSFVATFVDAAIRGHAPTVEDRQIELLNVQDAAAQLVHALGGPAGEVRARGAGHSVGAVWRQILDCHEVYAGRGQFPDLSTPFKVALFNTYRAALFPAHQPIPLVPHTDARGTFVEYAACHGGPSQSSRSSTQPGVTRGDHFHLQKVERFSVVCGTAEIRLRRMFSDRVVRFRVTGDVPVAVDMPVGWAHSITNVGSEMLTTNFWTNELFDPEASDTYAESVESAGAEVGP